KITLFVKNMVSNSCIKLVKYILAQSKGIEPLKVELGKCTFVVTNPDEFNFHLLEKEFENQEFPIIHDKNLQLVEQIKVAAIELIHFYNNSNSLLRNSDYLSEKLETPYHHLSKVFSDKTGTTLEKYIILLKIERVKELLFYNEFSVSEISYMMGYSSVQYLSNQFKQVTGISVTDFKKMGKYERVPLENLI
ncbi:MAG: AraC family transcriptional regulator, partial [Cytophagales bacterium]|nr:AraC family transcriptional regulator [Cytophagales bacterium]